MFKSVVNMMNENVYSWFWKVLTNVVRWKSIFNENSNLFRYRKTIV